MTSSSIAIIGAGPAGLMVADILSRAGHKVRVFDRMPSVARKFLMAGRGGLNLTHSEPLAAFIPRYGDKADILRPMIEAFPPQALRNWADELGAETFVGSSGRVFPKALKASPLLRAWLRRLEAQEVDILTRYDWRGWDDQGQLVFDHDGQTVAERPDVTVVAVGGASWPKLGSTGTFPHFFVPKPAFFVPFRPSNMGFKAPWSEFLRYNFAGKPLKNIALMLASDGQSVPLAKIRRGELMITRDGIEGGAVYALSAAIRDRIDRDGTATVHIDLRPDLTQTQVDEKLSKRPKSESLSNALRKRLNLPPAAIALIRETGKTAHDIKALPITLTAAQGLDRAISSAGGLSFDSLNSDLSLKSDDTVFVAGEMLDWEAPTGGYLLQATFSMAVWVANGILRKVA